MSGDVQPRKRKDKKRKKDDLGVNEPRGTSAALGEGDSFMHSHHDHGTGGHWCAKVIFFSLLAILVALIGLIILENRGLSELEANSVQSQYSGVLEGWLEDAPEDDHHDTHTLELNHHDDEDEEHGEEIEHGSEVDGNDHDHDDDEEDDDEEDHDDDDGSPEDEDNSQDIDDDEETQDDKDGSQEQDLETNDEDEELPYRKYYHENKVEPSDDDGDDDYEEDEIENAENNDDDDNDDEEDENENAENNDDNDEDDNENLSNEVDHDNDDNDDVDNSRSVENDDDENQDDDDEENDVNEDPNDEAESEENNKDEEEHDEEEEDTSLEVEKIEQEASEEEEPISAELPTLPEPEDDDDDNKPQDSLEDEVPEADDDDAVSEPDDDFLEADDDDEPPVERITAPAGKPFAEEEEEETSSEKPADTLAEEEEYEKRQEELRKEEAQASHMWLKLTVGGALLVATHAIVRRATASSDEPSERRVRREETPIDRRMTLIPEEPAESVPIKKVTQESTQHIPSIVKSPPTFEESEEEVEDEEVEEEQEEPVVPKVAQAAQSAKQTEKQELYSDEEDAEDDEVEIEEEKVVEQKAVPQVAKPPTPEPDDDVPDDVEIIEDEEIEEEAEEDEEDEEEISDVDDEELLTRLEAKYGRLPEPERPQRRKDGGNSIEDEWPGEPSDAYWRRQLDQAEQEFNQGAWLAAAERAGATPLRASARARWIMARALDATAEQKRDNALLGRAITAYLELLKMNERLSDKKLLEITERTINRIQFRGTYLNAEPVYRLLIRRFPDEPSHRTNLTVMFLMANRADLAENVLKETLQRWPDDRLSLAQYGFVLKTRHNRLEEAAHFLQKALEGDTGPATEPRYYYHLGDTLLLLGRFKEAHEVHKRAAAHGHFLSPAQRSLYNVPRLKGQPWWNIEDTPYVKLARALEKSWRAILREGEAAKALYEQEKEGLKERGEWSQLDLFARGQEIPGRCDRAPVTCATVRAEAAAAGCRRGQVKFSAMRAGTHVRPHVGPTNCRLRMHLGLSNTKDTSIRVDQETRQWKEGKVFIFDDSFEHEVWHNGTGSRLVLIVDVWHPELTAAERRQLPAI